MHWNDTLLEHPGLTPTEKLVYHLLRDLGADSPQARARIARMLGLTDPQGGTGETESTPRAGAADNDPSPDRAARSACGALSTSRGATPYAGWACC